MLPHAPQNVTVLVVGKLPMVSLHCLPPLIVMLWRSFPRNYLRTTLTSTRSDEETPSLSVTVSSKVSVVFACTFGAAKLGESVVLPESVTAGPATCTQRTPAMVPSGSLDAPPLRPTLAR